MLHRLAAVLVLALALLLPAQAAEKRILVFGDSLSAGFGIAVLAIVVEAPSEHVNEVRNVLEKADAQQVTTQ